MLLYSLSSSNIFEGHCSYFSHAGPDTASDARLPAHGFRRTASGARLLAHGFRRTASGARLPPPAAKASGARLPAHGRHPGAGGRWSICHNKTGLGQPGLFELYGFSRHSESQPPLRRYKPDTMPKIIKNIGKTVSYSLWPPPVHA